MVPHDLQFLKTHPILSAFLRFSDNKSWEIQLETSWLHRFGAMKKIYGYHASCRTQDFMMTATFQCWCCLLLFHEIMISPKSIFQDIQEGCLCNNLEKTFLELKRLLGQSHSKYLRSFCWFWNRNCLGTMVEQEVFG